MPRGAAKLGGDSGTNEEALQEQPTENGNRTEPERVPPLHHTSKANNWSQLQDIRKNAQVAARKHGESEEA